MHSYKNLCRISAGFILSTILSAGIALGAGPGNKDASKTGAATKTIAKTYGGGNADYGKSIFAAPDGGYALAGFTESFGKGQSDAWVLGLNPDGEILWQKTYGGNGTDEAYSIHQTSDNGYIVAGDTLSFGKGQSDIWVLKLSPDGGVFWQKTFGGVGNDHTKSIKQTSDGGYVVAGYTESFGAGSFDIWVLKLSPVGEVLWQKTYGGSNNEGTFSIIETSDKGYAVAGYTESFGKGQSDAWVFKLNPDGEVLWQKTYGGSNLDYGKSIFETSDKGYVVAGYTESFGKGASDAWVIKLSPVGEVLWQKTYGGDNYDYAKFIRQTSDNGYLTAGYTNSFGKGNYDLWVMKLSPDGAIIWQKTYGGGNGDRTYSISETSDKGYVLAGYTESFGKGQSDAWVLKLDSNGDIAGSSDFTGASIASVADSGVSPSDSSATVVNTQAVAALTGIAPQDTSAVVASQYSPK